MSANSIKFYQTGTFTIGNRLLKEEGASTQSAEVRPNVLTSGHRACQGCGEALGARFARYSNARCQRSIDRRERHRLPLKFFRLLIRNRRGACLGCIHFLEMQPQSQRASRRL